MPGSGSVAAELDAAGVPALWIHAGLALLAVAWLTTALCSVPAHGRLGTAFSAGALRFLLATNWLRTAAWSARGLLALAMLHARYRPG